MWYVNCPLLLTFFTCELSSHSSTCIFSPLLTCLPYFLQDFHHDVSLKHVLVVYLNNIKQQKHIHEKECALADIILR